MNRFSVLDTPISGVKSIERRYIGDNRGQFSRIFCASQLTAAGWHKPIFQINHSITNHKGTIRGLHFQRTPYAEMKLVTCTQGAIWDVAVDLRKNSPTFLNWYAEELSAQNCRSLLIPEGCAHGYQTLTDNCELLYLHSAPYSPEAEGGITPNDPLINITWPIQIQEISARDLQHPFLDSQYKGIEL
jgi:dTDP-4-dehydrorhamnose 3,5-epimerase